MISLFVSHVVFFHIIVTFSELLHYENYITYKNPGGKVISTAGRGSPLCYASNIIFYINKILLHMFLAIF